MDDRSNTRLNRLFKQEGEDDDDLNVALALIDSLEDNRAPKWHLQQLNWTVHVEREVHAGSFDLKYHMPLEAFTALVEKVCDLIQVDHLQAIRSTAGQTGPILPEHICGMGLRFLGGELIKSLEDIFGVHQNHVRYLIFEKFLPAVDTAFDISLPTSDNELEQIAAGFSSISQSNGLFDGCVGAIDGWLCTTCQPIDSDIKDKRAYFSGHYQRFGLNIQAICDSRLRFIYFAVAAPGRTNDARAFLKCHKLRQWMKSIESSKYFIVGDNAYVLCDELLIPYSGTNLQELDRTFNFFCHRCA